ncbi:hypothetical protein LWI29_018546 [Acer saccharum]|uniref:Uncharacterized protein n=1 Tax=Acer saccharum TaxID=4024 RepID=A0AA39SE55_ACESA|nr:hypothetical protein LWI29_018546 [Acer saccharum]
MITIQEVVENEDNSVVEQAISEETDDYSFEAPHVSMFALYGKGPNNSTQIMRILGRHKRKRLHILIDIGSTHNFLDTKVAKAMGRTLSPINPLLVEAAGSDINCSAIYRQFEWELQGVIFKTDLYIIPLGATKMVLGVQWMLTLGDITWNLNKLKMKFQVSGKVLELNGL